MAELQRCSREIGESSTKLSITAAFHQLGFYGKVARRKPLPNSASSLPRVCHRTDEVLTDYEKYHQNLWSDVTKIELFDVKSNGMCGENQTLLITCPIPSIMLNNKLADHRSGFSLFTNVTSFSYCHQGLSWQIVVCVIDSTQFGHWVTLLEYILTLKKGFPSNHSHLIVYLLLNFL